MSPSRATIRVVLGDFTGAGDRFRQRRVRLRAKPSEGLREGTEDPTGQIMRLTASWRRACWRRRATVRWAFPMGAQAVSAYERERFDVILMDGQMPVMDGIQATAAIREKERTTGAHIPIVAVTAHALDGDRERFLAAGMDGYVPKPVRASELFAAIDSAMQSGPEAVSGAGARSASRRRSRRWRARLAARVAFSRFGSAPGRMSAVRDSVLGDSPGARPAPCNGALGTDSAALAS